MSNETERNFEFLKLFCCLEAKSRNTLRLLSPDTDGSFIIRSNLLTFDEAAGFIKIFQAVTKSQYKLYSKKKPSIGLLFQTKWVCHLAEVENCTSEIFIDVKRRSTVQKKRDKYLRLSPPLCAVIKINEQHNHSPKISKIPKEIRETYYGYFNNGITGVKAKHLHEKNLAKRNIEAPDGSEYNPSMTAVYNMYTKWKKLKENAEINKGSTCDSGPHACSRIDSAFISQEIKIEPVDEDYDPASNILNETVNINIQHSNNFLDYEDTVYHQNKINVKVEEDVSTNFNPAIIHQREVTLEIEAIVQKVENCQNMGLSVSNSQENQLNGRNSRGNYNSRIKKRASHSKVSQKFSKNRNKYNSHIKKRASHSKVSQKFSKNRNKHKSPKIVNCCSLNTRSQNNAMPSTLVVTNSNPSYFLSTSVQTNNFVSIINPSPVPLITNVATYVNTNVVCQVQRAVSINNSHLTLYNPSSNTYTVVQLCTPASPNVSSSNIYGAHFPNGIQSPTRVGINKF